MSKQQTIEAIRKRNPTAAPEFLIGFSQQALDSYLRRLTKICGQRGPHTVWRRQSKAAIVATP